MLVAICAFTATAQANDLSVFFNKHCIECHNADTKKAGLDLSSFKVEFAPDQFTRWVKIYDRIASGEMPPKGQERPAADELLSVKKWLHDSLVKAEQTRVAGQPRTGVRRLTRAEYENTVRDLFDLPGLAVQGDLPADGSAHGFDKNSDALDISHVNLAKYVEAADRVLNHAIATMPNAPKVFKQRITLACAGSGVPHVMLFGDAVALKDKKPDPQFPPPGEQEHLDQGAHEQLGSYKKVGTVGLFRHEDESFQPYFIEFATLYPGRYRVRTSLWSFQWDRGEVLPSRGVEAARLSAVQLPADGRHTGHPSYVLGYFDAPSLEAKEHEIIPWLNFKETLGFNAASLVPGMNTRGKNRALGFTGPGIACDWLDVEGPLNDVWPPIGHQVLFGDLPIAQFKPEENAGVRPPRRKLLQQEIGPAINRPDPLEGIWTVRSEHPLDDANRLLATFLPKAFRRPVQPEVVNQYVAIVDKRLKAGDCFETAMRFAFQTALCSPDFLYHVEPAGELDGPALACRLSYFFWNSQPDERLMQLGASGKLNSPDVIRQEVERLLADPKSQRFVEDFLGQWLKLRQIAATDPDRKLYPEFSAYLKDSMVAETRAYFRELVDKDLDAKHLVQSNFIMVNEKLARHYGILGVSGSQMRRVEVPPDCPRGGFLTQASILKITANGTTTSPVPRGAFVMDRILGQPPEPPPPNIPAIEPDVRGAKTIREQLDKHRSDPSCASCHVKMDPPGFALEAFDVIGGFRKRYRSIGEGDAAERGLIDPNIGLGFKLGPTVDPSGELPDGRTFKDIREYQALVAADPTRLLTNLAEQFAVYSTGRPVAFSDRDAIAEIVQQTQQDGGGIRTLLHKLTQSTLFKTR